MISTLVGSFCSNGPVVFFVEFWFNSLSLKVHAIIIVTIHFQLVSSKPWCSIFLALIRIRKKVNLMYRCKGVQRHFVQNFTERINFYQYSQPSPSPCTPQYRCLLNITLNNSNEKLSVHIILLLLLFRLCVEGRVFLAVAEISRDLKIENDYAK